MSNVPSMAEEHKITNTNHHFPSVIMNSTGVFHEENIGKTYLNLILVARISYNLDAIY